jgi:hypothetical protein
VRLSFGPPLEDLDKGKYQKLHLFAIISDVLRYIGLDAMGRVLRKVRKEGVKVFGHNYRKSIGSPTALTGGHF